MKCGVWSVECEVWGVKSAVWSVECEVWSVDCEVWSVECEVWSVKCWSVGVWSEKVWTVKCEVWSVKCEVWECAVGRVQCEVAWSVECGVWSVKCGVWSVKCEVELQLWHVKQDTAFAESTRARAWLAHGACKFYRWERSYIYIYYISLRQLPLCLVRVLLVSVISPYFWWLATLFLDKPNSYMLVIYI